MLRGVVDLDKCVCNGNVCENVSQELLSVLLLV